MITLTFKDVGQGDSIFIEWGQNSNKSFGIIDCNRYNGKNGILEEVVKRQPKKIDFIILSHLHHDHYSGLGEVLNYCITNGIIIERFLHTFGWDYLEILDLLFFTTDQQKDIETFITAIDNGLKLKIIKEIDDVTHNFNPILLEGTTYMQFFSPSGNDYIDLTKSKLKYKRGDTKKKPDFNEVATIINISDGTQGAILTSDAKSKKFERIREKIKTETKVIQVPHHGSQYNLDAEFWIALAKTHDCPAVFSVGLEGDKLPKKSVVEFFDNNGFHNESTNFVHGLSEYYQTKTTVAPTISKSTSLTISTFGHIVSPKTVSFVDRFNGDKIYNIL